MFKINVLKRTFVRQINEDGCGPACLGMLLRYAGREADASAVIHKEVPAGGLSLHQLKVLANSVGLSCRCVEMQIEYLKNLKTPVILHTVNELGQTHFQICYGYYKSLHKNCFIIADPAIQVHYVDESDLAKIWVSKAALYIDNLNFNVNPVPSFFGLIRQKAYPTGLLVMIPFLSLCIASFGISLTWLLQKGLTTPAIFNGTIIYYLVSLLFIICIFRSLFSFLRQYILIKINMSTNRMVMNQLVSRVLSFKGWKAAGISTEIRNGFVNVQHIQNAVSAFISIALSDGCMTIILLSSSFYILPLAGVINLIYIFVMFFLETKSLPELLYQAGKARLLSGASEKALIDHVQQNNAPIGPEANQEGYKLFYSRNLQLAKNLAVYMSKRHLLLECLGTLNLIFVMGICVFQFESHQLDYESLLLTIIEAYLITSLMQKICSSFQQIAEGADAVIAHHSQ